MQDNIYNCHTFSLYTTQDNIHTITIALNIAQYILHICHTTAIYTVQDNLGCCTSIIVPNFNQKITYKKTCLPLQKVCLLIPRKTSKHLQESFNNIFSKTQEVIFKNPRKFILFEIAPIFRAPYLLGWMIK